jgi:hypothetical protein
MIWFAVDTNTSILEMTAGSWIDEYNTERPHNLFGMLIQGRHQKLYFSWKLRLGQMLKMGGML